MSVIRWSARYQYPGIEPIEGFDIPEDYDSDVAANEVYVLASDYDALAARLAEIRARVVGVPGALARDVLDICDRTADSASETP